MEENAIPCVNQAILFGHKLSHWKFEIHVVNGHAHRRLQTQRQNINSSDSNALRALKGDGRWLSHGFIARYGENHTYGQLGYFRPTLQTNPSDQPMTLASGARVSYAIEPPTKLLALGASHLCFRPLI